jgi:hypothetical protein
VLPRRRAGEAGAVMNRYRMEEHVMTKKRSLSSLAVVVPMAVIAMLLCLRGTSAQTILKPAWPNDEIAFTRHTITDTFDHAHSVFATDIDGDTDVDVVGAAAFDDKVTWWENDGSQNLTPHTIDDDFDYAHDVYATDLDGDGDVDILGAAINANAVTWWENDGHQSFTEHEIGSSGGASSVYAIDLDEDGDVDVLSAGANANDVIWWENDGDQNFTRHDIDANFESANCVYATDVDGDGDLDVLASAYRADDIAWWENDGDENFTKHIVDGSYDGAKGVYAADLDGDGDVDVLGAAMEDNNVAWWENDGSEHFTKHVLGSFSGAKKVYAADVDGDGDTDILAAGWGDGIAWWENDGNGHFTQHTIDGDVSADSVYAVDLDGDGDVDVLGAGDNEIAWWEQPVPPSKVFIPVGLKAYAPVTSPPEPPVLDDIANEDGDGNYTVSWSAVSGASGYTLQEDDNAVFSSPSTVYSGPDTSKLIAEQSVGTYYYRVWASNELGNSDWSETKSVEVTTSPPPTPEPSCPEGSWSGTTDQGYSITFEVSDTGGCQVDELTITWRLLCVPPLGDLVQTRTFYDLPISSDQFKYEDWQYTITGEFITQYWAKGTWEAWSSDGLCNGDGTWEANR